MAASHIHFEAWAEERAVSLHRTGSATIPGDRLMLRRALSNLLSNAIRHTPSGQTVQVFLESDGVKATIAVENPGPEIPPEHLDRLFGRFYRVDVSPNAKETAPASASQSLNPSSTLTTA